MRFGYTFRGFLSIGIVILAVLTVKNAITRVLHREVVSAPHEISNIVGEPPEGASPQTGVPSAFRDYCQFLEDPLKGTEGIGVDENTYKLRGLTIVTRHGERSPLVENDVLQRNGLDCAPFHEADRKAFWKYTNMIKSDVFKAFVNEDVRFKTFDRVPESSKCSGGMMTAEGALQHHRLGSFLLNRYANGSLFDPEESGGPMKTFLVSSLYPRTYQSILGLISGFLFPLREQLIKVELNHSNYTFLCTEKWCDCPNAPGWRKQYRKEHEQYYVDRSPPEWETISKLFQDVSITAGDYEPFVWLDKILGFYICRRQQLPCILRGDCVSYDVMHWIIKDATLRGERMFSDGEQYANANRLQIAEAHTVIGDLSRSIQRLRTDKTGPELRIFSGHDVTVGPLLRVLRIPFDDPPRYASRVVVEMYENRYNASDVSFRLIYNGVDKTSLISFCLPLRDGLCPGTRMEEYFAKEMWNLSPSYKNFTSLCHG